MSTFPSLRTKLWQIEFTEIHAHSSAHLTLASTNLKVHWQQNRIRSIQSSTSIQKTILWQTEFSILLAHSSAHYRNQFGILNYTNKRTKDGSNLSKHTQYNGLGFKEKIRLLRYSPIALPSIVVACKCKNSSRNSLMHSQSQTTQSLKLNIGKSKRQIHRNLLQISRWIALVLILP